MSRSYPAFSDVFFTRGYCVALYLVGGDRSGFPVISQGLVAKRLH